MTKVSEIRAIGEKSVTYDSEAGRLTPVGVGTKIHPDLGYVHVNKGYDENEMKGGVDTETGFHVGDKPVSYMKDENGKQNKHHSARFDDGYGNHTTSNGYH